MTAAAGGAGQAAARPTLVDIARESGVSRATVSLVLRNSPTIPERTRERVLGAAKQLGYVYNRGAASLRSSHTRLIAMAVNDLTNPYFAEIVAAIEDALTAENRIVLMANARESTRRQSEFVDTVREYNVDGLIMVPAVGTDAAFVDGLKRLHLPCVLVSRTVEGADVDTVHADHRGGMAKAVEHLIGLGHRRVGMIGLNRAISTGRERYEGYRQALDAHGLGIDPDLVLAGPATRDTGMAQCLALLDGPHPPTAIACFNDVVAFGAMLALRSRGLVPGRDVSVVGFDDIAEATLWRPALTSVAVSRAEIARTAVDLLLRAIESPGRPSRRAIIDADLVVRDTTAPPPRRGRATAAGQRRRD